MQEFFLPVSAKKNLGKMLGKRLRANFWPFQYLNLAVMREFIELLVCHVEMLGLEALFTLQRPPNCPVNRRL